ncbi:glycosyltransferase family 39 protein [Comamonas flocculans]|uniref:Glycosyltransferase family 39 protein n=1 Tax=Comamonas flocculans TaxID=2597701 RepID=A0A5B8RTW0_9BURK|nr:glycosyltransferase family 39 protein [Comamonas flocculans]QEA12996.1 glycosyltransferase family 39 protein [Comamonas flocculans]
MRSTAGSRLFLAGYACCVLASLYLLAWSVLPPLLIDSLPLDVTESLTWGREWQWGYYKHPPLAPWVLHVFHMLLGKTGPFLLSQLCIALTLWLVWRTALRVMDRERAFLAAALTMAVAYYTRPALEFNHNIAQMPLWAALGYSLLAALQDGRRRDWLLWGLCAGLGMLTKYSVAILLAVQGLYLLFARRQVFSQPGPYLAALVGLAVFAPHLYWLWQTDWLPMAYASARAEATTAHPRWAALGFLGTQVLNHLPLAVIALLALSGARRAGAAQWRWHCRWPGYVLTLALGSGVLVTLLGVVTGARLRGMWGVPMWAFSAMLLMALWPQSWLAPARPRLLRGLALWLVSVSVLSGLALAYGAQWRQRPARTDWPQAALAQNAQRTWQKLSHCPLDVVAGDDWLSGLVAATRASGPSVLIGGDARLSPWVTPERLRTRGGLWLWQTGDDPSGHAALMDRLPADGSWHGGQWQLRWPHDGEPWTLHWRAYVPAACAR